MKSIVISVPYGMSARNILRSEGFRILRNNFRVVILTPLCNDAAFLKEFEDTNVVVRNLPRAPFFFRVFRRVLLDMAEGYYFTNKTGIDSLIILRNYLKFHHPNLYWIRKVFCSILSKGLSLRLLRAVQLLLARDSYYDKLCNEFSPDMIWLTHSLAIDEFPLAFFARRRGIPVVAMIHSWDMLTSKSGMCVVVATRSGRMLPIKFDKVIVWNSIQQKQLIDYYDYSDKDVKVVGIPQFDAYTSRPSHTREEFLKLIGANPDKKLITFAVGNSQVVPKQHEIIESLLKAQQKDKFHCPTQVLIRDHPGISDEKVKEVIGRYENVIYYKPGIENSALAFNGGWSSSNFAQTSLHETLLYSDIVINIWSTISLDAVALDKPTICVAFDGDNNYPYYSSILRFYDFTHYKNILLTGGVRLAKSSYELVSHINDYLKDPLLDAVNRRRIVEEQCYRLDGKAGERIGNFVSDFVKGLR